MNLNQVDPETYDVICKEMQRQDDHIELIASENYVSRAVLEAQGSALTNKYAEGYPGARYYGGCEFVDMAENIARKRALELFGAEHANVQPHSGTQANVAVYMSFLKPGDKVLGMALSHGGHLTHGHPLNFSGINYNFIPYGVGQDTELIDYNEIEELAKKHRPKMIVAGASAYPRVINFARLRQAADEVEALFMVDMAHIAGLVAAGLHPSPVPHAHLITTTTHKTLRGPRGGMILCLEKYASNVDRAVFPGSQGGPLIHVIAAKAVCFKEALQPEFRIYQEAVVKNARILAESLNQHGLRLVSGGTDNHMLLVDLRSFNITGARAEDILGQVGITVNKNSIPFDPHSPKITSGIRLGTPAITTRGFGPDDMHILAEVIAWVIKAPDDARVLEKARKKMRSLVARYPLYPGI